MVYPLLVVIAAVWCAVQSFMFSDPQVLGGALFAAADPAFLLVAGGANMVVGLPFGLLLPTLKAGDMAKHWRVPRQTYLLSRSALRGLCSVTIGCAAGTLAALPFWKLMMWPIAIAPDVLAVSLVLSTARRFRRHRCTEWVMPPPGYEFVRPLLRAARPDA
ncbi:hypothetical protein [Candidatus Laterigemmans baculatus]|uniref:hypothetical protein n=1 Tax=Candidatus Laterigemmans baculatus TaxID=2770505 RepID=UPI0013D9628C|nr:hypothetical protein [Candidatus Laterigemmans baculatus]